MYVIEVFPISRGVPMDTLSYFSATAFEPGTLISVPFRKNPTPAIVLSSRNARDAKAQIKSAAYALKKITDTQSYRFFSPAFIRMVRDMAEYFLTTPGAILYELIPQAILANPESAATIPDSEKSRSSNAPPSHIIQAAPEKRIGAYIERINTASENDESVICIAPSATRVTTLAEQFREQTDGTVYAFSGGMSDNDIRDEWNRAVESNKPVVAVMTPHFLALPRTDLGCIILENESSSAYKQRFTTRLNLRTAMRCYARHHGIESIRGDTVLNASTLWQSEEGDSKPLIPITWEYTTDIRQLLVDMKTHADDTDDGFATLSKPLEETLEDNPEQSTFLLAARKGLHPFTVCGDCGKTITCKECEGPLVLKKEDGERIFVCSRCNRHYPSEMRCSRCDSWKLWALGIGTEHLIELLEERYPERPLFLIDKNATSTKKQAREVADNFKESTGGILVGTQMATDYLDTVDILGVVSIDSPLSIPDININQRIFGLLTDLRLCTRETFILQTRSKETGVLKHALTGNVRSFYNEEIEAREAFSYPPFSLLIKITRSGPKDRVQRRMEELQETLNEYESDLYPSFTHSPKDSFRMHLLLKIPPEKWPVKELRSTLSSLGKYFTVDVAPESIL